MRYPAVVMDTRFRFVETYYRQELFDFWSKYRNPFYATTFRLDITRLKAFSDERGHSVYVNLCYLMTRAMRAIEDFRYRLRDGRIVLYDEIHPAITLPAPGGLFTFVNLAYHPDVDVFKEHAAKASEEARHADGLGGQGPTNRVFFTALPKVPFTSFTHATNLTTSAEPQVAFGKFARVGKALEVPVGIQVNHLFIDGNALGELVERTQACFEDPKS